MIDLNTKLVQLTESAKGQFHVDLGYQPVLSKSKGYDVYKLSKEQIGHLLDHWHKVKWEKRSEGATGTKKGGFHATTVSPEARRGGASAPLAHYLSHPAFSNDHVGKKVLYSGVGQDEAGRKMLKADAYDPTHPDPNVRKVPKKKYDIIHSHYTLNVMSKGPEFPGDTDNGYSALGLIHHLLKDKGHAVISVRRDKPCEFRNR